MTEGLVARSPDDDTTKTGQTKGVYSRRTDGHSSNNIGRMWKRAPNGPGRHGNAGVSCAPNHWFMPGSLTTPTTSERLRSKHTGVGRARTARYFAWSGIHLIHNTKHITTHRTVSFLNLKRFV